MRHREERLEEQEKTQRDGEYWREGQRDWNWAGSVHYISQKRVREDGRRVHISPVRDHNELMFQVFPSFLEINCGGHRQPVGRSGA